MGKIGDQFKNMFLWGTKDTKHVEDMEDMEDIKETEDMEETENVEEYDSGSEDIADFLKDAYAAFLSFSWGHKYGVVIWRE